MSSSKPKIFISFSTKDMGYCKEFIKHLDSPQYEFWYQEEINIGQDYKKIIRQNIYSSVATVLLLSNNFLNSKFINEEELPWIVEKDQESNIYDIFPVQIDSCNWEKIEFLKDKQIFPSKTKSLNFSDQSQINILRKKILTYFGNAGYIKKKGWFR